MCYSRSTWHMPLDLCRPQTFSGDFLSKLQRIDYGRVPRLVSRPPYTKVGFAARRMEPIKAMVIMGPESYLMRNIALLMHGPM